MFTPARQTNQVKPQNMFESPSDHLGEADKTVVFLEVGHFVIETRLAVLTNLTGVWELT